MNFNFENLADSVFKNTKNLEKSRRVLECQFESIESGIKEAKLKMEKNDEELNQILDKLKHIKEEIRKELKNYQSFQIQTFSIQINITRMKKEIAKLNKEILGKDLLLQNFESELSSISSTINTLDSSISEMQMENSEIGNTLTHETTKLKEGEKILRKKLNFKSLIQIKNLQTQTRIQELKLINYKHQENSRNIQRDVVKNLKNLVKTQKDLIERKIINKDELLKKSKEITKRIERFKEIKEKRMKNYAELTDFQLKMKNKLIMNEINEVIQWKSKMEKAEDELKVSIVSKKKQLKELQLIEQQISSILRSKQKEIKECIRINEEIKEIKEGNSKELKKIQEIIDDKRKQTNDLRFEKSKFVETLESSELEIDQINKVINEINSIKEEIEEIKRMKIEELKERKKLEQIKSQQIKENEEMKKIILMQMKEEYEKELQEKHKIRKNELLVISRRKESLEDKKENREEDRESKKRERNEANVDNDIESEKKRRKTEMKTGYFNLDTSIFDLLGNSEEENNDENGIRKEESEDEEMEESKESQKEEKNEKNEFNILQIFDDIEEIMNNVPLVSPIQQNLKKKIVSKENLNEEKRENSDEEKQNNVQPHLNI